MAYSRVRNQYWATLTVLSKEITLLSTNKSDRVQCSSYQMGG